MPWSAARFVEFGEKISPSFLSNNLAADGRGRFAFAHGARVQCIRKHDKKQGRNDFTLAMKLEGCAVTEIFFWHNLEKVSRPILVVGTDCCPRTGYAQLQLWDTRNGRGTCLHSLKLGDTSSEPCFVRGLGNAVKKNRKAVLFAGMNTGDVFGYELSKKSTLEPTCTLKGLIAPVTAVAGDRAGCASVAAADERGTVVLWGDSDAGWRVVYRYEDEDDYVTALGLKGSVLMCGHASGRVSFHEVRGGGKVAETVTNAKAVTCVDVHPVQDIALIGGEDCRATVLALPTGGGRKVHVLLSVCLEAAIVGGRFTGAREGKPDVALLLWDRPYLVKFEFDEPARKR